MSNVIEGFESLTRQQMADMSSALVRSNGRASLDGGGYCTYGGCGCAAACFLKPGSREKLRGGWKFLAGEGLLPEHEKGFVEELQLCHDFAYGIGQSDELFMQRYNKRFSALCKRHGLIDRIGEPA